MEVDAVVTTVFKGRTIASCLNQRLSEELDKLAEKVIGDNEEGKENEASSENLTFFERVSQVKPYFDWDQIRPHFEPVEKKFQKSVEVSLKLREKGDGLLRQNNVDSAIRAYSLALAFAPTGSDLFCTAYANRSAALYEKGRALEALADIQRALDEDCPEGLMQSLEERKRKCEDLLETEKDKPKEEDQELSDIIDKLFEIREPHPKMPTAESFVKMEYSEEKGRHLVVTKNVRAGTLLMIDKPFVSVLTRLLKWETSHCHNCSKPMVAGVPCATCTFAMFCCDNCRKTACDDENGVHRFEHNYLPVLYALKCPHGDIQALRILALLGPSQLLQMYNNPPFSPLQPTSSPSPSSTSALGYDDCGIFDIYSYLPTFRLISHSPETTKASMRNALKSLVLVSLLRTYSPYFDNFPPSHRPQMEVFAASLVLRHLENIKYNAFSLKYAAALFPAISLCNHSCDPNCAPIKQSAHLKTALIALKPMKEGSELCITYKPLYTIMTTPERQKFLSENYRFNCHCQPCTEDWGPGNYGSMSQFILETTRCESCNKPENSKRKQCFQCAVKDAYKAKGIQKLGEILYECHSFVEQEKWTTCLQRLPKIVDYFGRNGFNSHFPLYHVALDLYKRALMNSVANY